MKKLLTKSWFQMILGGIAIGIVFILLDNKFDFLGKKARDKGEYNGIVSGEKDKMYITTADYSETAYNFGKIKEGDTVVHVFRIQNTGKEPLFIYRGVGSCDCIRVFFKSDPIDPGTVQDVTVVFLSKGRKGKQQRTVMIDTNTDPSEMILSITGEVE